MNQLNKKLDYQAIDNLLREKQRMITEAEVNEKAIFEILNKLKLENNNNNEGLVMKNIEKKTLIEKMTI